MAPVTFTVTHAFTSPPDELWAALIDWDAHGEWIPATRMDIAAHGAQSVGDEFTAYTGYGPLTLVDRMRVSKIDWDATAGRGECEVEKLGPVLSGTAGFVVEPDPMGSRIEWFEDVDVKRLPKVLAAPVSAVSALGFRLAMRSLARTL